MADILGITGSSDGRQPGAPTIGSASASDFVNASVSFTAPAYLGKPQATTYTVTSSPGSVTATGATSPIVVTGLTLGTAYTFTVTLSNGVATSAASSASNSVTPIAAPFFPPFFPSFGPFFPPFFPFFPPFFPFFPYFPPAPPSGSCRPACWAPYFCYRGSCVY